MRVGRKRHAPPTAVLAALAVVLASGCSPSPEDGEPLRIGIVANMQVPEEGGPTWAAARLAVAAVGDGSLEVAGRRRKILPLLEDSGNSPSLAVDAARRLIHQRKVLALVGPNRSRDAIRVADVAENARVPMISPGSTHPYTTAGKRYVFRAAFVDSFQGDAMARFAREELAAAAAAVLYDAANDYNRHGAQVFRSVFEGLGGEVVAFEPYVTGESDFDESLLRIRARRPRVLFLPNYFAEVALQTARARELGLDAVFLGSDGWTVQHFPDLPHFEGAFYSQHWHAEVAESSPPARRFLDAYRLAYGREPTNEAALTYDAVGLVLRAIAEAGTSPDRIRDALAETDRYRGVTGTISYRGGGDPRKPLVILRIRDGRAVFHRQIQPAEGEPAPPEAGETSRRTPGSPWQPRRPAAPPTAGDLRPQ